MANKKKLVPKWKSFEESAQHASLKIFNAQTVKPNQKVMGVISETLRQIDIKVGDNDFIDIECKDHSKPIDLPKVEQFANKLKDENAKSGIMISNAGFTKAALKTAEHYNIKPVVLVDKGHDNASNFIIKAPVLAEGLYLDAISYGISTIGQDFRFSPLVWDMKAAEGLDQPRSIYEVFRDHWNDGTIEVNKVGTYEYKFDQVPIIDLQGNVIVVDLTYNYVVKADIRKGYVGTESARGFYDVNKKTFTSSESITFEPIEIGKISEWPRISNKVTSLDQPFRLIGQFPLPDDPPLSSYKNPFTGQMLDPKSVQKGIYI